MNQNASRVDTAQLASISESQALRFRQVFIDTGYLASSPETIPEVIEMRGRGGRNLPRLLRLTSAERPLDVLVRLFMLGVPVRLATARSALSSAPLEEWCDAGLLKIQGEWVESLVAISPFEQLLLTAEKPELLDHGADADYVCSVTNSTASLARFMVQRPFAKVLDLCTGCGALAFIAARQGGQVLATDLNPRAVQIASFNARLNGIRNVEFAVGSTFEPAIGRAFDLITANPPCVLGPASRYSFRDSGEELDNFCRKIITEAHDYLADDGIFQCTLQWPNIDGADWRQRISELLQGISCDALVLHLEMNALPSHTEETVFDTDILDFQEQSKLFDIYMNYFQSRRVTSISEGLIALHRRSGNRKNWIQLENLPTRTPTPFGDAVYQFFKSSDALESLNQSLFDLNLRMVPSLSLETQRVWNGVAWEEGTYRIRQKTGFEFEASADVTIANLIRRCDGTHKLRDLVAGLASDAKVPFDSIASGCLKVMSAMVQRGFLILPE
jgi:hypothetical protein